MYEGLAVFWIFLNVTINKIFRRGGTIRESSFEPVDHSQASQISPIIGRWLAIVLWPVAREWPAIGRSLALLWSSAIGQALGDEWPPFGHWSKDHCKPTANDWPNLCSLGVSRVAERHKQIEEGHIVKIKVHKKRGQQGRNTHHRLGRGCKSAVGGTQ